MKTLSPRERHRAAGTGVSKSACDCYLNSMATSNRRRLTRAVSQALTRERLIEAARQEIARRGASASVRDIAEAAGYTQGALYAHFQTKEFLLLELLRQHMDREIAELESLLAAGEEAGVVHARVEQWLETMN